MICTLLCIVHCKYHEEKCLCCCLDFVYGGEAVVITTVSVVVTAAVVVGGGLQMLTTGGDGKPSISLRLWQVHVTVMQGGIWRVWQYSSELHNNIEPSMSALGIA